MSLHIARHSHFISVLPQPTSSLIGHQSSMASAPATQGGLNKDAEPWRPAAASYSPSSIATPESLGYSQSVPMFPQHPQPCHAPFLLAHHLYRKPNFVYQPTVQPSFFTLQPVTMQCLPYIETYNTGHQAETEQVQLVVPENRGRSRTRGQRSAPRRNRIVPDRPRNRAPKQKWRRKAGNGNPVNDGSLQIQPSRKQPKNPIPLESGGEKTTVMIRNIPSKYTTKVGTVSTLPRFVTSAVPNSRYINCAKFQGKDGLVKHFEVVRFPLEEYQPLCFEPARDGSPGQVVKEIPIGGSEDQAVSSTLQLEGTDFLNPSWYRTDHIYVLL
ncbi:hypothetical protein SLEP1_g31097 [Rubroshorea leprosula]|uniref:Uncharacterized protein n=1 Tax=Rubroshorea leprosula TaxID=152421 RepID=A0AAV5K9C6_9ROSI|nr:hypothetical protein SLEP1_g31097 [Rubroshorea leprosula]